MDILSDEENEKAQLVICSSTPHFMDDVRTNCFDCGVAIVHRPHAPKKPIKVCFTCAGKRIDADPNPEFSISQKTADELKDRYGG